MVNNQVAPQNLAVGDVGLFDCYDVSNWRLSLEVFVAEQVVDGFNGVECGKRHFDEQGGPMSHSPIPQSGQFLRFERDGSFGFLADEACCGVDKLAKVEIPSAIIFGGAYQVHRIEVGGAIQNGLLRGVFAVDLGSFDHLQALLATTVEGDEWAAARLTLVFDHAANAHGAV